MPTPTSWRRVHTSPQTHGDVQAADTIMQCQEYEMETCPREVRDEFQPPRWQPSPSSAAWPGYVTGPRTGRFWTSPSHQSQVRDDVDTDRTWGSPREDHDRYEYSESQRQLMGEKEGMSQSERMEYGGMSLSEVNREVIMYPSSDESNITLLSLPEDRMSLSETLSLVREVSHSVVV
jgi:hypothetical protein